MRETSPLVPGSSHPLGKSILRCGKTVVLYLQGKTLERINMNTQSGGRTRPIATAGLFLLIIGLLLAVFYAVMCRYDDSAHQLSDLAFVVLGISLQLAGLGFIIWKK
jgi:hypothetical protein